MNTKFLSFFLFFSIFGFAQTFNGKVIDKITKQPIETASVYFNNTTVGTTTNSKGEFSISFSDEIQSNLVVPFLGYESVYISNYRAKRYVTLEMIEAKNSLDEVYIEYDDGLTRKQKLKLFRKEFLGTSRNAKSCEILNEDALVLRYKKATKTLHANASTPITITNKALQYQLQYDIIDFNIKYNYVNLKTKEFVTKIVSNVATSAFKDTSIKTDKKVLKKRAKAYNGSVQHFTKTLYHKNLKENKYLIAHRSFVVNPWEHFSVEPVENSDLKKVSLKNRVDILYKKNTQSFVVPNTDVFYIDQYGNYTPNAILFGGEMGKQRVGDMLPLDFKVED